MKHKIFARYSAPELCQELGRIMAESFRSAFAEFISKETLDRCAVAENCAALLANLPREMTTVTGWLDGKLMGLLVFSQHPEGRTEIEAIHSLPETWGTGLGAAMLEFALEETNAEKVAGLWAFEENARARRFYEKHGFAFTGETRISEFDGAVEVRYERKL
jgi:ribosomal protein S18 acetylase RimI-like enzyme